MEAIELEKINYSAGSLLEEACKSEREKTFFEFPSRGFKATYGEFQAQAYRIANLLERRGISKGDMVAIMSENSPELACTLYATVLTGAVWVPINSLLVGESLQYIIDVSDSAHVIVSSRYRDQIEQVVGKVGRQIQVLPIEELDEEAEGEPASYVSPAEPDDLFCILFTSGTTGFPKGVLHTHRSATRSSITVEHNLETTSDDRIYMQLPFSHVWASATMFGTIYFKATMIVEERFEADTYWKNVDEYKITQGHWTGTIPLNLLKLPETDLEQKEKITVVGTFGGMYDVLEARWPNIRFQSVYGFTEHPCITIVPAHDIHQGSDGKPNAPDELFILDENSEPLPVGETGEIAVRCNCGLRMQGYYKNPEATAEALRGGFLYTGDLGYLDERGHLHFAGRKKDALRVRGEMVSIDQTEHLINQHPKVAESAITPYRPAEKEATKEDEIVAHIVLKGGEMLPAEEFHLWSEKNLPKFMRPRYVVFRESFPKTATERIQHFKLKDEGIKGATKVF